LCPYGKYYSDSTAVINHSRRKRKLISLPITLKVHRPPIDYQAKPAPVELLCLPTTATAAAIELVCAVLGAHYDIEVEIDGE